MSSSISSGFMKRGFRDGKRAARVYAHYIEVPDRDALLTIINELGLEGKEKDKLLGDDRYNHIHPIKALCDDEKHEVFLQLWMFRHEKITLAHIERVASEVGVSRRSVVDFIVNDIMAGKSEFKECSCGRHYATTKGEKQCPLCHMIDTESEWSDSGDI